jgi:hypothetical protein
LFFLLAAIAVKFATREDWGASEASARSSGGESPTGERTRQ